MTAESTIVIIGAGQAGGWAAATLRKDGFAGRIVLFGAEQHRPYERPPLSKAVLKGQVAAESCYVHKEGDFAAQQIDFRPGTAVERIDTASRHVHPVDGDPLAYDRLILCTGGRPRTLDVPGGDLPGVLTLRTFEDAQALGDRFRLGLPVVVIGGGWIGLEAAAVAREYACPVTLLEAEDRLCRRTVPPVISDYLLRLHTEQGVDVRLSAAVESITETDGRLTVALADGDSVAAGTVVVGVGLVPNDELAAQAGLVCDRGIVVDAGCRTSDPYVFAAGDVTVTPNPWASVPVRLESWQNAQNQAIGAAKAALGQDVRHEILPWFWSDQYHIRLQIYGLPGNGHAETIRGDVASDNFSVLFTDGDRLTAAMGPGAPKELRTCKSIIEKAIVIDPRALADPARPLPRK